MTRKISKERKKKHCIEQAIYKVEEATRTANDEQLKGDSLCPKYQLVDGRFLSILCWNGPTVELIAKITPEGIVKAIKLIYYYDTCFGLTAWRKSFCLPAESYPLTKKNKKDLSIVIQKVIKDGSVKKTKYK